MRIENKNILIIIIVLTLLFFPVATLTTGVLRLILGILFVIIFPGYALLSAINPKQTDLGALERLTLSFGVSIAITSFAGLILHFTIWGLGFNSILISISIFILAAAATGYYRQSRLKENERTSFLIKLNIPAWGNMTQLNKILSVILGLTLVIAIGSLSYTLTAPKQEERFTEFYILNENGRAQDYPEQLVIGESLNIIVGIVNHEDESLSYTVITTVNGIEQNVVSTETLAHEEKYEQEIQLIPQIEGNNSKVEFSLYKDGSDEPYFDDPLHLYIDIIAPVSKK
jgi:uncharacterized membrane protein